MAKKEPAVPADLEVWIEARRRFRLTHAQVQMARELSLNPKTFGKLANHDQEPWKLPLPAFIEECYWKRFKKDRPDRVLSIEDVAAVRRAKQGRRRQDRSKVDGQFALAAGPVVCSTSIEETPPVRICTD